MQIFWSPSFASLKVKVHTRSMSRNQSCTDSSENSVGILQYHGETLAPIDSPFISLSRTQLKAHLLNGIRNYSWHVCTQFSECVRRRCGAFSLFLPELYVWDIDTISRLIAFRSCFYRFQFNFTSFDCFYFLNREYTPQRKLFGYRRILLCCWQSCWKDTKIKSASSNPPKHSEI